MKFNAVDALINRHGYTLKTVRNSSGIAHDFLTKTYERVSDVAWHGPMRSEMTVEVHLSADHESLRVYYYDGRRPIKVKTHLNDKHAYNAIRDSLAHHSYEI